MKILIEKHETETQKVCLYELQGRTAQKFGLPILWEVRTYKKSSWLRFFVDGTLEGVSTTKESALTLFGKTVLSIEKQAKVMSIEKGGDHAR